MNEVVIPLKIQGIAQMKAELRELKGELANATDPSQMAALAQQAGVLTDKIKDTNEAVKVFASGSKFEQVSNGLGGIQSSLMSLDFEEAAEKSKVFATALGGINKADIAKSMKGIVDMTKTLSAAFIKLGATILMNPIFLIVGAVVAIIAVVTLVLKSFGVLDNVIKALMAPINALIAGFKKLTDWLGLTQYSAKESAEQSAKAFEKGSESINQSLEVSTGAIDRQIAEQKALGKNTYLLEVKRTYIVQWAAQQRLKLAKEAYYKELALGDSADKEKLKKLKAQLFTENQMIANAKSGRQVLINTKLTADSKPKEFKEPKISRSTGGGGGGTKDTGAADIQKIIDETRLANLNATLDAIEVEKNAVNAKYADLIAKAKKYKKDTSELEILQMNEINNINVKEREKNDADKKAEVAAKKAEIAETIKLEDAKYLEIQRLTAANEQDKVKQIQLTKDYEKAVLLTEFDEKIANLKEGDALLIQLQKELTDNLAQINKDAAAKELALVKETEQKKRAETMATAKSNLDTATDAINAIGSLTSIGMEAKLKGVKKGSKEEEQILRSQFKQQKAMQLAMAAINGAQAILAILSVPDFTLGVASGIRIAASVAATAASIATISGTQFNSPASAPSGSSGSSATTAVVPSGPSLFGQANTGSQVNAGGSSNNITVTAVVSETEITASQNNISNIQQNSVL